MAGPLGNPKREMFCRYLSEGHTITAAYEAAGYRGDRRNGSALAKSPDIVGRLAEIVAAKEQANPINVAEMKGEAMLRHAAKTAMTTGNLTALVQAGKELGSADGSLDSLGPRDGDKIPDSHLAQDPLVRLSYKTFLRDLNLPIPSDEKLAHAILVSMGNASACGFTDGHGNPIPTDNPNKRNGGVY